MVNIFERPSLVENRLWAGFPDGFAHHIFLRHEKNGKLGENLCLVRRRAERSDRTQERPGLAFAVHRDSNGEYGTIFVFNEK